jgi:hypothetical protein
MHCYRECSAAGLELTSRCRLRLSIMTSPRNVREASDKKYKLRDANVIESLRVAHAPTACPRQALVSRTGAFLLSRSLPSSLRCIGLSCSIHVSPSARMRGLERKRLLVSSQLRILASPLAIELDGQPHRPVGGGNPAARLRDLCREIDLQLVRHIGLPVLDAGLATEQLQPVVFLNRLKGGTSRLRCVAGGFHSCPGSGVERFGLFRVGFWPWLRKFERAGQPCASASVDSSRP